MRFKGEIDLVTEADLAAEKVILSKLAQDFPAIPVLSEEASPDYRHVAVTPTWIVDPLDGTTNFAHGFPLFVACGRLDGFWERELKPWDTAAGYLMIEEAGGQVSNFAGGSWDPYLPGVLVSNGQIHGELVKLLR